MANNYHGVTKSPWVVLKNYTWEMFVGNHYDNEEVYQFACFLAISLYRYGCATRSEHRE